MKGVRVLTILRRGPEYLLMLALGLGACPADALGVRPLFIQNSGAQVRELVSFPMGRMPAREWMRQSGWEEQKGSAEPFTIEDGVLYMQSFASSTTIGKKLESEIEPDEFPEIEFCLRVDEVPPDADVTNRKKDDAAFRLFVLFDKGGILSLTPPHTIGYVWDSTLKQGETGRAATFGQVRYIVIGSGSEGTGDWKTIRRNIRDDYKLLFGKDRVPGIKAVGLKCDSNHTKTRAASAVRFIRFIGPERQPD